ncbi:hypothetical protein PO587_23805 [Streptomyces gilvifuscus]|uniref:Secreted protein n=1 Tax=Streptomyces gilvifuscus TaxID=1550617 RepID=A0ABT5FYG5_9ACTN|nr:hypothetical protein [Streptomyces gilvifuscus]MDC2957490.1 hypothetical protein [Streptomyces gilvifuscus]
MKSKFRMAAMLSGVVMATLPLASTASASDYEGDIAKAGNPAPDASQVCVSTPNTTACFQAEGDFLYVKDLKADGNGVSNDWHLSNGSTRRGQCGSTLGAGKWGYCDKDFPEGVKITFGAYYGGTYYSKTVTT